MAYNIFYKIFLIFYSYSHFLKRKLMNNLLFFSNTIDLIIKQNFAKFVMKKFLYFLAPPLRTVRIVIISSKKKFLITSLLQLSTINH